MKGRVRVLAAAVACLLLSAGALYAYDVPKEIVIKRPEGNPPLADWVGSVKFPHGFHAVKNACEHCHHKESAKNLGEFLACTQCHKGADPNDNTGFYRAWHNDATHSCLGCHRKVRLANPKALPPLSCTDGCHKKK
ncbi:MAG: cytochrome c3 family protein [Desulfovibrionaceae bacterium]|jgi:hypothetical protein|nr:cytochrome c3 family protein [Desulfovibrionaceae bacterium]